MPFDLGTPLAGLPAGFDTHVETANLHTGISNNQTLIDYRERYINTVDSQSHNTDQVPLNFNTGDMIIGGIPRGEYAAGTTYATNDAVRVGDNWFVSRTDANTGNAPATSPANWQPTIIDYSRGQLTMLTDEAFQAAMGTQVKIRFANGNSSWSMFNTVLRTAGALRIDNANTVRMDEVVIFNEHATEIPYFRDLNSQVLQTGSYIGTITLDGTVEPFGWYLDRALARANSDANGNFLDNGGLLPRDAFILRRGILIADGGGADRNNHVILANIDATNNLSDNDLLAANGSGASANTLVNSRVTEIRNSADGLDFNIGVRFPTGTGAQAAGQALVTRQMNFNVVDEDGTDMQGVTLRIPVIGGTDTLGAGGTLQTFNANIGSNNLPAASEFMSIDDAAVDETSAADGTFPQQLMHLGYWQTQTQNADGRARRVSNGANYYLRHGNQTTAFFSQYGSVPGASQVVNLNGEVGAGTLEFTLMTDATVTGIPEPAAADINFVEGTGGASLDIVEINANRTLDEVWGAIRSYQVTQTVTGDGRTDFNQGVMGQLIDIGGRGLEINRAGGTAAGVRLNRGNLYVGFTNVGEHRAEGTITYDIDTNSFIFFDTGSPVPTTVIDGGAVNGTFRLPPGDYTVQNADVENLTIVRDPAHTTGVVNITLMNVENAADIDVSDPNVIIETTLIISGGTSTNDNQSRLQLYPLTGTNDLADQTADEILGATGLNATYPLTLAASAVTGLDPNNRYVLVWTRPGFEPIRQVLETVVGENTVTLTPVRNVLASNGANVEVRNPDATIDAAYDRTNERVVYTINQGTGDIDIATNVQTNNLFEQSKSDVGYGEYIAKNTDTEIIQHTGQDTTYLRVGSFELAGATGGTVIQHNIGFVGTITVADVNSGGGRVPPGQIRDINAVVDGTTTPVTLESVLIGALTEGATYGDVDSIVTANRNAILGNLQAQTTQIRTIMDEELRDGTLTNIGRD